MTITALARCTAKACPVRYATGPDRDCGGHDHGAGLATAAAQLGIDLAAAPGDRGDGDGDGKRDR